MSVPDFKLCEVLVTRVTVLPAARANETVAAEVNAAAVVVGFTVGNGRPRS